jgi:periplasmic divalent cation tolerance protein
MEPAGRTIEPMAGQGSAASSAGSSAAGAAFGVEPRYLQVQTTTDSRAEAMELARAVVQARLAACAQVAGPVASTYWWEDEIERAEEWLLLMKLPAARYQELVSFLTERHSYDEPEIVATPIVAGSESYLSWIEDETRTE